MSLDHIKNRLSLRAPQRESLDRLEQILSVLPLQKARRNPADDQARINSLFSTFKEYERDFPSFTFALATGVGKTRLMGAFVAYLFLVRDIRHFFVLAPNLTIYDKLIRDFTKGDQKYVLKGLGELESREIRVIHGDNYNYYRGGLLADSEGIDINIFNISKINSEMRGGREPKFKRLSEYLGESYFDYLKGLDNLVLMMDESHHYRAAAGLRVLNELDPVLGLELTATPKVQKGAQAIPFKNVVYEYSLALAMRDGFVKEPLVATRRNFNPDKFGRNDLEKIKLEDGIRIHEDTKAALAVYADEVGRDRVKPFVLIVCRDTAHADEVLSLIQSPAFFEGDYADRVIKVDSSQSGSEKDENIEALLKVEETMSPIEIVIHVNMLKEGWDVRNLYTIIPLRAASAEVLVEQTIGRGLRLPYGERTGEKKVDTLTIVSHDKFQAIVDAANSPDSIIKKENIVEIDPDGPGERVEAVRVMSVFEAAQQKKKEAIQQIKDESTREKESIRNKAESLIFAIVPSLNRAVSSIQEIKKPENRKILLENAAALIDSRPDPELPALRQSLLLAVEECLDETIETIILKTIEIPRIIIHPSVDARSYFEEFELDTSGFRYGAVEDEIVQRSLVDSTESFLRMQDADGRARFDMDPEELLVNELLSFGEVDYDRDAALLHRLAASAYEKIASELLLEKDRFGALLYNKRDIAAKIYAQMMAHFRTKEDGFEVAEVLPFERVEPHTYTAEKGKLYRFRDSVTVRQTMLFEGFEKSCHDVYKFDSGTEKQFAVLLEDDADVLKWMRPASRQFHIYWDHNSRLYEPDFVVETKKTIHIIETKAKRDIPSDEVKEKSAAAVAYCQNATGFTQRHGGKPWKFSLVPEDDVLSNMQFRVLADKYEIRIAEGG